jgi:hypothetical protein
VLLEGGDVPDPLREPKAPGLHVDRAREGGTPLVHLVDVRVGPAQVEVLRGLADHEHVDASLADNLVRELGSVALDVLGLGSVHPGRLEVSGATATGVRTSFGRGRRFVDRAEMVSGIEQRPLMTPRGEQLEADR